jgi:UPF0716 family protein affecting phage T7 exclusion
VGLRWRLRRRGGVTVDGHHRGEKKSPRRALAVGREGHATAGGGGVVTIALFFLLVLLPAVVPFLLGLPLVVAFLRKRLCLFGGTFCVRVVSAREQRQHIGYQLSKSALFAAVCVRCAQHHSLGSTNDRSKLERLDSRFAPHTGHWTLEDWTLDTGHWTYFHSGLASSYGGTAVDIKRCFPCSDVGTGMT